MSFDRMTRCRYTLRHRCILSIWLQIVIFPLCPIRQKVSLVQMLWWSTFSFRLYVARYRVTRPSGPKLGPVWVVFISGEKKPEGIKCRSSLSELLIFSKQQLHTVEVNKVSTFTLYSTLSTRKMISTLMCSSELSQTHGCLFVGTGALLISVLIFHGKFSNCPQKSRCVELPWESGVLFPGLRSSRWSAAFIY